MKACALLPWGGYVYKAIQKKFGRLNSNPWSRLLMQAELSNWLLAAGVSCEDKIFMEVGTGHNPIVPIGLFLLGARKVITFDLNRRLDFDILRSSLDIISSNEERLKSVYGAVATSLTFQKKLVLLRNLKGCPEKFLSEAGIEYVSPADASRTGLHDNSVDCHFSTTVLEHISRNDIQKIFFEAHRTLKPQGLAIHFIDLSDHFQHQDKSINALNFLQYSEEEWDGIAGNQFAYCNRLRASEFLGIFSETGFAVTRQEKTSDAQARDAINNGFPIDGKFERFEKEDVSCTNLRVLLKKSKQC